MPVLIERAVSFQWFWAPLVRHALGVAPIGPDSMPYWAPLLHPEQPDFYMNVVNAYKHDFRQRNIVRSNTKAWDQVWEPARQKKDRRTKCRVFQPNPFYQLRSGYMSLVNPAARRIVDQLGRCGIDQEYFDALCTRIVQLHARIAASVPAAHPIGDTTGATQPLPRPNPAGTTLDVDEDTRYTGDHDLYACDANDYHDYDGHDLYDYDDHDSGDQHFDGCDDHDFNDYHDGDCDGYDDHGLADCEALSACDDSEDYHDTIDSLPDAVFDVAHSPPDGCYEGQDEIQSYVDVNMDIDADIDFYNTTDDDEFAASDRDSIVPETNNDEGEASTPIGWDLDFAELGNDYTDLDDNAFMPLLSDSEFDASSGDLDHLVGRNDSVVESLADVLDGTATAPALR